MKSYTDISQSRKLAEILPLESSDMYWDLLLKSKYARVNNIGHCLCRTCVYAWSLAALLDILPKEYTNSKNQVCSLYIDIEDSETPYLIWYVNPEHEGSIVEIKTEKYSNLIDACYEMILKLNEHKEL